MGYSEDTKLVRWPFMVEEGLYYSLASLSKVDRGVFLTQAVRTFAASEPGHTFVRQALEYAGKPGLAHRPEGLNWLKAYLAMSSFVSMRQILKDHKLEQTTTNRLQVAVLLRDAGWYYDSTGKVWRAPEATSDTERGFLAALE